MSRLANDEYSDTTEEASSSEVDEYEVQGGMRTQLVWDAAQKQLSVALRQFLQTRLRAEVKYKGHLNTVTGQHHMTGQLVKSFQTNTLSLQKVYTASRLHNLRQRLVAEGSAGGSTNKEALQQISAQLRELKIDPDAFLPAGLRPLLLTDWIICPGVTLNSHRSGTGGLRPALILKKAPQVLIHSPRTDVMLSGKAITEFGPGTNNVSAGAGLRLKLYKYGITSKQDLKVSLGLDMATTPLDASTPAPGKSWFTGPYLKISENNTSVKLQGGKWTFLYTL